MKNILKILCLFIFICQSTFAGDLDDIINSYDLKFHDPFLATFIGSCRAPNAKFNKKVITESRSAFSSPLFKKALPLDQFIFNDSYAVARVLTFVNPGIFTDLKHNHGRLLSMRAIEGGSNVVLIPNALGLDYLSSLPNFSPSDIEKEGQVILDIAYKKINELKSKNIKISKVIFMGVSYGSFLSAIAMAKDKEQKNLVNQVLIFNPPFEMGKGLRNLDKSLDESDEEYKFMGATSNIFNALKYCKKSDETQLKQPDFDKIKSLTAHLGFHSWLIKSINFLRTKNPTLRSTLPSSRFGFFSKEYRKWRKNMRFEEFINIINPQSSITLNSEKGNLTYWLDHVPEKEVFVLSSDNDFLVEGVTRPDREWYYELKNGGHFGIQPTSFFSDLLKYLINR
jgi:hypothetical protein